jgi:hypothetical protein
MWKKVPKKKYGKKSSGEKVRGKKSTGKYTGKKYGKHIEGKSHVTSGQGLFRSLLVKHAHCITSGSSSSSLLLKYDLNCTHILLIWN